MIFFSLVLLFPKDSSAYVAMKLPQYINEVLLNNYSLRSGIKNIEASYYLVLASVTYQRPNISGSANVSYTTRQLAQSESNVFAESLAVILGQRIDISGSYTLDEQQNILGYESSRARFSNSINSTIASAEEVWWSAVLARESLKLQKEILLQRSENHRVTVEKFNQELVPRLDIVRSEAQVVEAEARVKTAETVYLNYLAQLSYMAGGLDVEPVDEELHVPEFDVVINYEEALEYRPDVRAARIDLERAKLVKQLTSKGMKPTLDFGFQWTLWADPEAATTPNSNQAGLSLTLNVPIYDGKQTKYKVMNTDRLIQAAEANLEAVKEETRFDITVAMNKWRNAAANERDKKRQVERSEEELKITELMYSEGMGAQIDLINAQASYQSVKTEYLDSVKSMYVALVALRKAIGDYSPDESGSWHEALSRYGKGNDVLGETGLTTLRVNAKNAGVKESTKAVETATTTESTETAEIVKAAENSENKKSVTNTKKTRTKNAKKMKSVKKKK